MTTFILDCTDKLKACTEYHACWAAFARDLASRAPQSFFTAPYQAIYAAAAEYEQSAPANQTLAYQTYIQKVLDSSDFDHARKQVASYPSEMAEWMISYHNEELDRIFIGQPFESDQVKYRPGADMHASQVQKISQSFHHYISPGLSMLRELAASRQAVKQHFLAISPILQRSHQGTGFAETAQNSVLGWLAFANPVVGVPLVAVRLFHGLDKARNNDALLTAFQEQFQRYAGALMEFSKSFPPQTEAAASWIHRKFTEINVDAIGYILLELTKAGYSIDHYTQSLDYARLHQAEQELTS